MREQRYEKCVSECECVVEKCECVVEKCVCVCYKKDMNVVLWMNTDVGVLNIFVDWVDAYKDNYNYVVDKVECVIMEPWVGG